MTEIDRDPRLVPLDGWPAWTLTFRGGLLEMCAGACVLPLALESFLPGRWFYWAIPIGVMFMALMSVGATWTFKSFARSRKEVARGYTTIWRKAKEHPELTYLSAYDLSVISGPHQSRPRNGTRRVVDQFREQREIERDQSAYRARSHPTRGRCGRASRPQCGVIGDRSRHQVVTAIPWGMERRGTA